MTTPTENQPLTENQTAQNTTNLCETIVSESSQPEQRKRHRRWGKIPSLPTKVRFYINESLRDGTAYAKILEQLAADGYSHITHANLVHWNETGFLDWLRDQEHFEKNVLAIDKTRSHKIPETSRKKFRALSQLDLAIQLHTAARQFNLEKFCEHLEEKPETFLRLVQANASHERNAILRDRNEIELKKIRAKKPKRVKQPKQGGVTPEELLRLTRRINL